MELGLSNRRPQLRACQTCAVATAGHTGPARPADLEALEPRGSRDLRLRCAHDSARPLHEASGQRLLSPVAPRQVAESAPKQEAMTCLQRMREVGFQRFCAP